MFPRWQVFVHPGFIQGPSNRHPHVKLLSHTVNGGGLSAISGNAGVVIAGGGQIVPPGGSVPEQGHEPAAPFGSAGDTACAILVEGSGLLACQAGAKRIKMIDQLPVVDSHLLMTSLSTLHTLMILHDNFMISRGSVFGDRQVGRMCLAAGRNSYRGTVKPRMAGYSPSRQTREE